MDFPSRDAWEPSEPLVEVSLVRPYTLTAGRTRSLVDPHELSYSADLNWKSVWDNGWSAAHAAESVPAHDRTDEGLPIRRPGARLVPGGTAGDGGAAEQSIPVRDPDAVRASIGSHFGGVQAGRRHARETEGTHAE